MKSVKGFHADWHTIGPEGWGCQRIAQELGKLAWKMLLDKVDVGVDLDFDHPLFDPLPGIARTILRAHEVRHGKSPVHVVLLTEPGAPDFVLEKSRLVDYLNSMDGVTASLALPGDLSVRYGKVFCRGLEATVIFMGFKSDALERIGEKEDIAPIKEAVRQNIIVNPVGMEPLGDKGLFEAITGELRGSLSESTVRHTPWTRVFATRRTTGPDREPIDDLPSWVKRNWKDLVLKPAHGSSGHGIFAGSKHQNAGECIRRALASGGYVVQQLVPLAVWSEPTTSPAVGGGALDLKHWQTDLRCFITDEGLQGFLARFGGIPVHVESGGIQPLAVIRGPIPYANAVDKINEALMKLGSRPYMQIQEEIDREALIRGFIYRRSPIRILLRPRLLTEEHLADLSGYAKNLWIDAIVLEELWRQGSLNHLVKISEHAKEWATNQPWRGSPAVMVSDGLFGFGAEPVR